MTAAPTPGERELANRDVVVAELGVLRARLRVAGGARDASPDAGEGDGSAGALLVEANATLDTATERLDGRSTLDELTEGFGLTSFERSVLLLAAGPELVAAVADELVAAGGGPRLTFGTALAVLPDAHWSALTPPGPLRRWSLVRLLDPLSPTRSPLVVDERVLHHLAGAGHLDERLAAVTRALEPPGGSRPLSVPRPRWSSPRGVWVAPWWRTVRSGATCRRSWPPPLTASGCGSCSSRPATWRVTSSSASGCCAGWSARPS